MRALAKLRYTPWWNMGATATSGGGERGSIGRPARSIVTLGAAMSETPVGAGRLLPL